MADDSATVKIVGQNTLELCGIRGLMQTAAYHDAYVVRQESRPDFENFFK